MQVSKNKHVEPHNFKFVWFFSRLCIIWISIRVVTLWGKFNYIIVLSKKYYFELLEFSVEIYFVVLNRRLHLLPLIPFRTDLEPFLQVVSMVNTVYKMKRKIPNMNM